MSPVTRASGSQGSGTEPVLATRASLLLSSTRPSTRRHRRFPISRSLIRPRLRRFCLSVVVLVVGISLTFPSVVRADASAREISEVEKAAVQLVVNYLSDGPEALLGSLAATSSLKKLPVAHAAAEIEVRLGPPADAAWKLQTVERALTDSTAAFEINFPSGIDELVLMTFVKERHGCIDFPRVLGSVSQSRQLSGKAGALSGGARELPPVPSIRSSSSGRGGERLCHRSGCADHSGPAKVVSVPPNFSQARADRRPGLLQPYGRSDGSSSGSGEPAQRADFAESGWEAGTIN